MKKNIMIVITLGTLIGYLFGQLLYKNYDGKEYIKEDGNIYFVQYGVYTSNEVALENASRLDNYKIVENDDKYYVYLGITTNLDTALKIQELYKQQAIYSYIRSDYVTNSETLEKLKQYDEILSVESKDEDIKAVVKEIFSDNMLIF